MRAFITIASILTLALPGPAQAAKSVAPIELARVGKWNMRYENARCTLIAQFGEGDGMIVLRLVRFQPGDGMGLRLFGKPVKLTNQFLTSTVDFGPVENPQDAFSLTGTVALASAAKSLPMLDLGFVRLDDLRPKHGEDVVPLPISEELEKSVTWLAVKLPNRKVYRLQLGSMGTPMKAMRACTSDLVKSWGYDPETVRSLRQGPTPTGKPGNWVMSYDYPTQMLRERQNALIRFRMDVQADGSIEGCHVLESTGDAAFAKLTCALLTKRGSFKPAIDAAGKPVRGYFVSSVRWAVP